MWSFAIRNSSWLLPCMMAAVFALCAGVERLEVLTLEKNAAIEQAAAEKAVNDAKAVDALKTARLEAEHAAVVKTLQEKANAQQVAIAGALRSDACLHTGAARAFLDGLSGTGKARSAQP